MYWVIKYTAFIHNSISNFVNCYAYLISNKIKNTICHTVGTVPKYATLSEQFQNQIEKSYKKR